MKGFSNSTSCAETVSFEGLSIVSPTPNILQWKEYTLRQNEDDLRRKCQNVDVASSGVNK